MLEASITGRYTYFPMIGNGRRKGVTTPRQLAIPRESSSIFTQMEHGPPVRQGEFINGCKVPCERLAECRFGDVRVDGFASANKLVKLRIGWGNPFEYKVGGGQCAAQRGYAVHRDLAAQQEMVQHGQHHDCVEVTGTAVQEGGVLAVLPSGCGGWMREVDAEGENILSAALQVGAEAIDGLQVSVDRDDFCPSFSSQQRVNAGVAADVEKACGLRLGQCRRDEAALARVVLVAVVGRCLGIVRPGGRAVGGGDAAHLRQQALECLEHYLLRNLGVLERAWGETSGVQCFVVRKQCR